MPWRLGFIKKPNMHNYYAIQPTTTWQPKPLANINWRTDVLVRSSMSLTWRALAMPLHRHSSTFICFLIKQVLADLWHGPCIRRNFPSSTLRHANTHAHTYSHPPLYALHMLLLCVCAVDALEHLLSFNFTFHSFHILLPAGPVACEIVWASRRPAHIST